MLNKFFGNRLLGGFRPPQNPQTLTKNYSKMKLKQIAKNRVRNKIARRSRRINRLRMG